MNHRVWQRAAVVAWCMVWNGCTTVPPRTESAPRLSDTQVATLLARAMPADKLGIELSGTPPALTVRGADQVNLTQTATLPLVDLPGADANDPSSRYRVPVVQGMRDGKTSVHVLLDSGSNRNLLGYSLAQVLDVRLIAGLPAATAHGVGGDGRVDSYWAVLPELKMGSLEMRKVMTLVAPDAQVLVFTRSFWGETQTMILGMNALRSLSYVSLDYMNGRVTFEPSAKYMPDAGAEFVTAAPLRWEGQLPVVDITIEGRYQGPAVVDTGGHFGLLLSRQLATELEHWKPGWGQESSARGIAGEAKGRGYIVHRVRMGEASFRQVPTLTHLEGPEPLGGRVVLGNYELRRYRVTFDFRNSVLWLER